MTTSAPSPRGWPGRRPSGTTDPRDSDAPAFPQFFGTILGSAPLAEQSLNQLIRLRAEQAALLGTYTFTSLRSGLIRTALRDGAATHLIANHEDLASLNSVTRHAHRENLISASVASRLGL